MLIASLCVGGGYVISPANQGKQSVVKHMLAMDWKFWKSYLFTSSAKHITIKMLGRVAGKNYTWKILVCSCVICFLIVLMSLWLMDAVSISFPALRELFRAKLGNYSGSDFSSGELTRDVGLPRLKKEDTKPEMQPAGETSSSPDSTEELQKSPARPANMGASFLQLNDAADEFFDFPDEPEYDHETRPSNEVMHSQFNCLLKASFMAS